MKKILVLIFLFAGLGVFAQSGGSNRPSTGGGETGYGDFVADSLVVNGYLRVNNPIFTDYITDGSKVDGEFGFPLNIGNTILGYQAFAKDARAGDSA